jgi:hypothetical protein
VSSVENADSFVVPTPFRIEKPKRRKTSELRLPAALAMEAMQNNVI